MVDDARPGGRRKPLTTGRRPSRLRGRAHLSTRCPTRCGAAGRRPAKNGRSPGNLHDHLHHASVRAGHSAENLSHDHIACRKAESGLLLSRGEARGYFFLGLLPGRSWPFFWQLTAVRAAEVHWHAASADGLPADVHRRPGWHTESRRHQFVSTYGADFRDAGAAAVRGGAAGGLVPCRGGAAHRLGDDRAYSCRGDGKTLTPQLPECPVSRRSRYAELLADPAQRRHRVARPQLAVADLLAIVRRNVLIAAVLGHGPPPLSLGCIIEDLRS